MTTHREITCDQCGKTFDNDEYFSCPSEAPTMKIFVGYKVDFMMGPKVGFEFGDTCKFCQDKLKEIISTNFPKAKFVKEND